MIQKKIHLHNRILSLCTLLSITILGIANTNYDISLLTSEDGLTQNYIYTINQDNNGYLWIGTGNGLNKYDGLKFEYHFSNDTVDNSFITTSFSYKNKLWIGHMNGDISLCENGSFKTFAFDTLVETAISCINVDSKKNFWASSYSHGLIKLNNNKPMFFHLDNSYAVTNFCFISEKKLFLGTMSGAYLAEIKQNNIHITDTIGEIPPVKIQQVLILRDDRKIVITENSGLFEIKSNNDTVIIKDFNTSFVFQEKNVQHVIEDQFSNLWVATLGNGIITLSKNSQGIYEERSILDSEHEFISNNIKYLFEDIEGNIWCSSYGQGLICLKHKMLTFLNTNPAYGVNILSICTNGKFVWLGTEKGLLKLKKPTYCEERFFNQLDNLPQDKITALFASDTNHLWIGTQKNGVYLLNITTSKIERKKLSEGMLENSVTCITGNSNEIWIGTKKGLFAYTPSNDQHRYFSISQGGLPHNYIHHLYLDTKQRLWLSTKSNAIVYIKNNEVFNMPLPQDYGNIQVGPYVQTSDSTIWFGTYGKGLYGMLEDYYLNININEGLFSKFCYALTKDNNENLWVVHRKGISRLRLNDLTIKSFDEYYAIDQDVSINTNAVYVDNNQKVYFGTISGLMVYHMDREPVKSFRPHLAVKSIHINGVEHDVKRKISLATGTYKFELEAVGVSLRNPKLVEYQYFLKGLDLFPSRSHDGTIVYKGLNPGNYTLEITCYDGYKNKAAEPFILDLVIRLPLYKRWWFLLILAIAIAGSIFYIFRVRVLKLKREQIRLEKMVDERTAKIEQQKEEIREQSRNLRQSITDITDSIRYASNIQAAIIPPSGNLNEVFSESFIINKPRDIVSGDFFWIAERNDEVLFTAADCTGHGVPGAFMSILGITLLDKIVKYQGITQPARVLNILRESIVQALHSSTGEHYTFDGISMPLCSLNVKTGELTYSGANSTIVIISEGKMQVLGTNRMPVGLSQHMDKVFSEDKYILKKGDMIYMFSDGFQDQFGGARVKKYSSKRFYETLLAHHMKPCEKQKRILVNIFENWKSDNEQTDDIIVLGVRY
ncbi:MAG: SpoIIE family protein phosphatase [Bacteroidales bacterium]|nr:SpoIIE family protein phosphatase [Bacteroidales bacterium]